MKENLVPQEQSLVLKELGFDKKCWGVWVNGRFEPRYKSKNSTFKPNQKLDKRNVDYCTAPTFEQAFDWFREKYNLDSYIRKVTYKKWKLEINYILQNDSKEEWEKYKKFQDYKDTQEEARQACLEKLIEITENK